MRRRARRHGRAIVAVLGAALLLALARPALAVDPPYQGQMEQLVGLMGSLYFLQPLCGPAPVDWRQQAGALIAADKPDDDRRRRLNGAFNRGFEAYARIYTHCTPAARQAVDRLQVQAEAIANDIHSHYAQ